MNAALLSSKSNEWETPIEFFKELDEEFHFTLDPCSTHENAKCEKHFTIEENGLAQSWKGETVFCNPPYGRELPKWIEKCSREAGGVHLLSCLFRQERTREHFMNSFTGKPKFVSCVGA